MSTASSRSFRAVLERGGSPPIWTLVRIPFDAVKVWGNRGKIRVKGEINGFPLATTLFPSRGGGHILMINKKIQKAARAGPGDTARFRLEPDAEERVPTIPPELERIFSRERALRRWYESLTSYMRWEIAKSIAQPASPEVRSRRAEQAAERLMATMEAERDLPPIMRNAFARNPQAQEGWKQMSASRRRYYLLGLYHCRTPEGQARRVARIAHDAAQLLEKRKASGE